VVVLAASIFGWAAALGAHPVHIPATWKCIDAGRFSFWAPPGVVPAPLRGRPVDSYVGEYRGHQLFLSFDYGPYSSSLQTPGDNLRSHDELIDGRAARLVSYTAAPNGDFAWPNFVAVHFPKTQEHGMRLTMYASCGSALSCREAEQIFRSIRFP